MAAGDRPGWSVLILGRPGAAAREFRINLRAASATALVLLGTGLGVGFELGRQSAGHPALAPMHSTINAATGAVATVAPAPSTAHEPVAASTVVAVSAEAPSVAPTATVTATPTPTVSVAAERATASATAGEPLLIQRDKKSEDVITLHPFAADGSARASDFQTLEAKMACGDGHSRMPDGALVHLMLDAEHEFQKPFVVLGGRCAAHDDQYNAREYHRMGRAVDVRIRGVTTEQLANWLEKHGVGGVGRYRHPGFVHIDMRTSSRQNWEADEAVAAKPIATERSESAVTGDDGAQPKRPAAEAQAVEKAPSAEPAPLASP